MDRKAVKRHQAFDESKTISKKNRELGLLVYRHDDNSLSNLDNQSSVILDAKE
jgi:hypothetical protein